MLLLSGLLLVYSCSKERTGLPETRSNALDVLMKTTDGEVRQQVYSEMSAQEKYDLWKKHFQYVKDSHAVGGDAEKRKLVQELENALSVDIFVDESNAQSVFLEYTGPQWMAKAKLVLSDEEIYDVTMENAVLRTPPADDIGQLPKCFCHVGNSGYAVKNCPLAFPGERPLNMVYVKTTARVDIQEEDADFYGFHPATAPIAIFEMNL